MEVKLTKITTETLYKDGKYLETVESHTSFEIRRTKRFFYICLLPLSSILYGLALKTFIIEKEYSKSISSNVSTEVFNFLIPLCDTMVILGATVSNFTLIFVRKMNIPKLMAISSILHAMGYVTIMAYPHVFLIILSKFIIGVGSGIAFTFISKILHQLAYEKYLSITLALHPIAITLGFMIGTGFDYMVGVFNFRILHSFLTIIAIFNSVCLYFLPKISESNNGIQNTSLKNLLVKKEIRTFLITSVMLHLGQHLSGIDYFGVFTGKLFMSQGNGTLMGMMSLGISIFFILFATFALEYLGEGIMMILSCLIVATSTGLLSFLTLHVAYVILFLFGFNLGLSFIPWGYAASKFSLEDQNASNNLGVTVNLLSSFVMANICYLLEEVLGQTSFMIYSIFMILLSIFSIFVYKEDISQKLTKLKDVASSIKCFNLNN